MKDPIARLLTQGEIYVSPHGHGAQGLSLLQDCNHFVPVSERLGDTIGRGPDLHDFGKILGAHDAGAHHGPRLFDAFRPRSQAVFHLPCGPGHGSSNNRCG